MRKRGSRIHHTRRDPTPFVRLFGDRSVIPAGHATKVGLAYHLALEEMKKGRGTDTGMNQLVYALNLALVLCELGFGAEQGACIHHAQECLVRMGAEGRRGDRWNVDEDVYRAIGAALEVHDQQVGSATQADIRIAEETIKARLAAGDVVRVDVAQSH
ncbi:Phage protein [Candidatus Burkholderia verschuerenii]|uniref:Phage protein n=1 Tax=Candidatus Burkholderia verschuerenii TaxID=242163 RepID=A0A0L0MJ58_9BURK|nr:Phage protein [Candidatus Burkholderia verschuerenii]